MCGKMSQRKLGINEKMALFLPIDWCALGKFSVLLLQKWHMFSDESLKIQLSISPYVNADIYMCVYIHIHIYTHTHICALSHVYMSIYLMQFLPAIWTQELANNVSVREKLRFLKSPGA